MAHPQTSVGDTTYVAKINAVMNALDRRLQTNIVVNGALHVWQRGTSFASGAAAIYAADRWQFFRNGLVAGATLSRQVAGLSGFQYCARVQRDNANAVTALVQMTQTWESSDVVQLQGLPLTVTFRARCGATYSSASSLLSIQMISGTGTDGNYAAGLTGSAVILSSSVTLTTSWQTFTAQVSALGSTVTQLGLAFSYAPVGTAGATDYFEITGVKLVPGDYCGDQIFASFQDELRRCQHHYVKTFPYATAPAQNAGRAGSVESTLTTAGAVAAQLAGQTRFPTSMFSSPTLTYFNPSAANAFARNFTLSTDSTALATAQSSADAFTVTATGLAAWAVGNAVGFHFTAEAEL